MLVSASAGLFFRWTFSSTEQVQREAKKGAKSHKYAMLVVILSTVRDKGI